MRRRSNYFLFSRKFGNLALLGNKVSSKSYEKFWINKKSITQRDEEN